MHAFVVLPIFLVSVVPISVAGWGVRESAMVMAFAYAGLMDSDGLIVSLLFGSPEFYGRHHRRSDLGRCGVDHVRLGELHGKSRA